MRPFFISRPSAGCAAPSGAGAFQAQQRHAEGDEHRAHCPVDPAQRAWLLEQAAGAARQQAAEDAVAVDPFVQALVADFGAHVVAGSIRHVDSPSAAA